MAYGNTQPGIFRILINHFLKIPAKSISQLLIDLGRINPPDIPLAEAFRVRLKIMLYLVTDTDIPAQLHLQKLQLRVRKNSMLATCRHIYHITGLDILHITINNGMSIAGKHRPYLIPVLMAVIIHAVPPV